MNFLITGAGPASSVPILPTSLPVKATWYAGSTTSPPVIRRCFDPDVHFTRGDVNDRPKLWTLLQEVDCV